MTPSPAPLVRLARQVATALGAAAFVLGALLAASPALRAGAAAWLAGDGGPADAERAQVAEVIDGDTLRTTDGRTIRILGVDTPETRHPAMAGPQPLGAEAAARLAVLVGGRTVRLERDAVDADDYGRRLRHVWVGGRLVAAVLAEEGLAQALVIPPNVRHADALRAAEAAARAAGRGLWGLARPTGVAVFATPPAAVGGAGGSSRATAAAGGRSAADAAAGSVAGAGAERAAATSAALALAGPAGSDGFHGSGGIDPSQPCGARVAGAIPADAAGDHVDTFQAVEFEVVRAKDTGKVTFLNSHDPYQGHFYAAVFPTDYADFPAPPADFLAGKCIVVQGRIELYRGAPQIVVRGADDVRVVDGGFR